MAAQTCLTTAHASSACDDATLLARAAEGDQSAEGQLIDEYDCLVGSVAASFRLQPTDDHDVTRTTWLLLLKRLRTIRDPERLARWLSVTAKRELLAVLNHAPDTHERRG